MASTIDCHRLLTFLRKVVGFSAKSFTWSADVSSHAVPLIYTIDGTDTSGKWKQLALLPISVKTIHFSLCKQQQQRHVNCLFYLINHALCWMTKRPAVAGMIPTSLPSFRGRLAGGSGPTCLHGVLCTCCDVYCDPSGSLSNKSDDANRQPLCNFYRPYFGPM